MSSVGRRSAYSQKRSRGREPWAKAASFGIWMEISDCVNLNGADFFQLNYSHKRSLSLDTGAE